MPINVRVKGAEGERQVANALNTIINSVLTANGIPLPPIPVVQRNQNQSAVGGGDLTNTFGLSIEVKRQEQLSVNTWWAQCLAASVRNDEVPVLVYRINNGKWNVVMMVEIPLQSGGHMKARATIEWDPFLQWFYHWVDRKIKAGEVPRT